MYAKGWLALLAASWAFLGVIPVGAHDIVAARDLADLKGRDATATAVITEISSSCRVSSPASGQRNEGSSSLAAASSTNTCPLASALCAACPASTTTVTVSSCPSSSAGTGRSASGTRETSSSVPSIHPSSSDPRLTDRTTTSTASPARPSSTPLEFSSTRPMRGSTPFIGRSTAPLARSTGRTLQTLPTGPGTGAASRASGAGPGSAITPRAAIPPGIVRRQIIGVMNITAPFANTSSILRNATSTLNVTRILTSATTSETTANGFRFHLRDRV